MKRMKKVLYLVMAGIMILGLCACNKDGQTGNNKGGNIGGEGSSADPSIAKQNVFRAETLNLDLDLQNMGLLSMTYKDDRIYLIVEDYGDVMSGGASARSAVVMPEVDSDMVVEVEPEGEDDVPVEDGDVSIDNDIMIEAPVYEYYGPSYYLISAKLDGSDKVVSKLQMDDTLVQGWMSGVSLLSDGSVAAMYEVSKEDWTDPNNPIWIVNYYAMKWDNQGNLQWTLDLTGEDGDYIYAQSIGMNDDGTLCIVTGENEIINIDAQGNEIGKHQVEQSTVSNVGQMITKKDGTMYVVSYDDNWTKIYINEFDLKAGTVGEKVELPGTLSSYSMYAGDTTDLILSNSVGLYTYNIGDAEPVKIMDYVNSDLVTNSLNNVVFINEKEFLATYYDSVNWTTQLAKFVYVDPADIPDKAPIVLGCNYIGNDIKKKIIDFNKTSNQYRITIKDYNAYNTMDDYTLSYTQMNNDIISGQMPDIMTIDVSQDIGSWVNKGLLVDVGEMISKDSELANVEFLENVWKAFSVNDKLYTVIPSFGVQTMIGRKDMIGDRSSWTMTEFKQFMATLPQDVKAFGDEMLQNDFIYYVMTYCGSDFVDVNTGKCNFDSPEFIAMLEYAKTFPKDYSPDYWEDYDWMAIEGLYRDKKAVLMNCYISQIQNLVNTIHGSLGAEASFVGFPGLEGNSSVISPGSDMFVLSAKSKNLDGAWQFVRQFLMEDYQTGDELYSLPVMKSAFEEKAKLATQKPFWIDEITGEKFEYENTYWINDEEIILEPFTQAEVDEICEFIYSIDKRAYYNQDIINIVNEEAQSFFAGEKSARDVAQVIQSRVQIFVDENR